MSIINRFYLHFKGGEYQVLSTSIYTVTGETLVNYQDINGKLFSRPYEEFFSEVEIEGKRVLRFIPIVETSLSTPGGYVHKLSTPNHVKYTLEVDEAIYLGNENRKFFNSLSKDSLYSVVSIPKLRH